MRRAEEGRRRRGRGLALALVPALLALPWTASPAGASAGSLDQAFGANGVVLTDLSPFDIALDVLVQPDGKTVTTGMGDFLFRQRADGTPDPTFGTGGLVSASVPSRPSAATLQADGKILVVGSDSSGGDMMVSRYLPSGVPDGSFGAAGQVRTDFGSFDRGSAVAVQPDGKVVVAGVSGSFDSALALARYLPNGDLDLAFGTAGKTTTSFGPSAGPDATAIGLLSTGAIVVGGGLYSRSGGDSSMILVRYTSAGTLDPTFGDGGRVRPEPERLSLVRSLVVQSGDRVVAAGGAGQNETAIQGLARYLPDGSVDSAFGAGGSTQILPGPASRITDVVVDGSGRLVTAGFFLRYVPGSLEGPEFTVVTVSRLSADGVVDGGFGCAGSTLVDAPGEFGGYPAGLGITQDGRILVGGTARVGPNTESGPFADLLLVRLRAEAFTSAGYWITRADGGLSPFGTAGGCGSLRGLPLNQPPVGHAVRSSGDGYWFVAADGGVFNQGDAPFLGSAGGLPLSRPMVGMAGTPSGNGYWLVAADGGIFAYGDAGFFGSAGGLPLRQPVVGMAATPTGNGYWLVAADGGIFAYGDAGFFGSAGGIHLRQPVVGMAATPTGDGYWLVAADGGIFAYGGARFLGSTATFRLARPVIGMARTASGRGYWLSGADGGIFAFGDAPFLGSAATGASPATVVAVTSQVGTA